MANFWIGTIQTTDDVEHPSLKRHRFELLSELTLEQYNKLTESIKPVNEFSQDLLLFEMVTWNFNEFIELYGTYLQAFIKKDYKTFTQKPILNNLNRTFLNLLSSIRSYLDFMERLLNKRFGKESIIFNNFKQYCSREYDSNFSYRFLYRLRNYAQHKGFPINRIGGGKSLIPDDPSKVKVYLEVNILRDEILNDFDWGNLENEVKNLPEKIDVIPHAEAFMNSLNKIHGQTINDLLHTLTRSSEQILLFGERLAGKEGEPVIFESDDNVKNIQKLTHQLIPIELAKRIVNGQLGDIYSA
jgi:hypothetical protein